MESSRLLLLSILLLISLRLSETFTFSYSSFFDCGVLYSTEGNSTLDLVMENGKTFTNLEDKEVRRGQPWNVTTSLEVTEGCLLKVCNGSSFLGRCKTFPHQSGGQPIIPSLENIRSASCNCPPASFSCEDKFRFRRKTCALAFVNKKGCDSFDRVFTEIEVGDLRKFPEKYENKLSAVIVRPGCKFTTYSEAGFEGDVIQELANVTRDVELPVMSTECSCEEGANLNVPKRISRSWKDPKSLVIPSTFEELEKLRKGDKGLSDHPGILAAMKSSKGNRSTRNAYILLLGTTGAGKSSAINLLFDNDVTSVGGHKSTTNDIHEFRIPVPVNEYGINNSELRVIDTPGLGDTNGLESDAIFLATLERYLNEHEELNDRIPNVVLIFHKFNDNRFYGQQSNFVKMLRSLDSLRRRLTDSAYSNVVFVLSHFMSTTQATTSDPTETIQKFKQTIREFSRFPTPTVVVVAENKPNEQGLLVENGYYKLPNGEFYPRNLLDAISDATARGEDAIGNAVIRSAFKQPDFFNISRIDYNKIPSDDPEVSKFFNRLAELNFKHFNQTEVSEKLRVAHEKMPDNLHRQFPSVLPELQSSLNMKFITTVDQLPQTPQKLVELLSQLRRNDAVAFLLQEAFNISTPTFTDDVVVGFSYDIFKDTYLPISPFQPGELSSSGGIGYKLPGNLICTELAQTNDEMSVFADKNQYISELLTSWGVPGAIPSEEFKGSTRPGWNIQTEMMSPGFNGTSIATLSSIRYFRTFELSLPNRFSFTPHFSEVVRSLRPLNLTSNSSILQWKQFFSDFGTHVVKSAFGGGSIEVVLKFDNEVSAKDVEVGFKFLDDIFVGIDRNRSALINSSCSFEGGTTFDDSRDLTDLRVADAAERLRNWRESVKFNPIILRGGMKLLPLSVVVRRQFGQNVATEVENAMRLLFNSDLKYKPPTTTQPPSREFLRVVHPQFEPQRPGFWATIWRWFSSFFG